MQTTSKRAKAYHVAFNFVDPIILVGDERGGVVSFKLSNSLFRGPCEPDPELNPGKTIQDMEIEKMDKYLNCQDKVIY
jgi:dynein intermediate chain 1